MKYSFDYKITIKENEPFDLERIKRLCAQYPSSKILIEMQNTKGVSSSMLRQLPSNNIAIRIAGGYDEQRIKFRKDIVFKSGETGQYYTDAVIYTRNETIKILEEIEKIENGISKNWSSIQKLVYIYDKLKTNIMYDPKYEKKISSEIRSLRGLISKQTVCAGYAMILKEMMDRIGIECEYVEGYTKSDRSGAHAWNIISINGKKYPIDLTWDNTKFRCGDPRSFDYLGQNIEKFSMSHHPSTFEKTQNYRQTLSEIDPKIVEIIYSQIARSKNYKTTTYYGVRNDNSKYILAQIENAKIKNKNYFRYYYADMLPDGSKSLPIILYSETNVAGLIDRKRFAKPIPDGYEDKVNDILFSKENIEDSKAKRTFYIGNLLKRTPDNKPQFVSSVNEIEKPEEKKNLFVYPTKIFTRSNGSVFIAQQMLEKPEQVKGVDVTMYDIFEMVKEDGEEVLKKNTVFTERNFFNDNRQSMADDYLSRERLDRKYREAGGYIGYYDTNGTKIYNPDLVSFFETNKKLDIDLFEKLQKKRDLKKSAIPSFSNLKELASKYEIYIDSDNIADADLSKYRVRDIATGQIQTDKNIIEKAIFANIWLSSAGVKYSPNEKRNGEQYAFNEEAEKLYNLICSLLISSSKKDGVIDTLGLYKNIDTNSAYKYDREIVVNLFRTPYQTELINKLFLNAQGIDDKGLLPETLYSISNVGQILYGNTNDDSRKR